MSPNMPKPRTNIMGWLILAAIALLLEILLGLFYYRSTPDENPNCRYN